MKEILKKKWFRVMAIVLAGVTLLGVLSSITAGLRVEDEENVRNPNLIRVADCDSLEGFKDINVQSRERVGVNTDIRIRGLGSVGATVSNAPLNYSTSLYLLHYELTESIDISRMTHFAFDMYVEDPAALNGSFFTLEIGSTADVDKHEIQTRGLSFSGLKNGWNHIEIELSVMEKMGEGSFDPENMLRFRLYNGEGYSYYTGLLLFDNFYFTNKPVGQMVS